MKKATPKKRIAYAIITCIFLQLWYNNTRDQQRFKGGEKLETARGLIEGEHKPLHPNLQNQRRDQMESEPEETAKEKEGT